MTLTTVQQPQNGEKLITISNISKCFVVISSCVCVRINSPTIVYALFLFVSRTFPIAHHEYHAHFDHENFHNAINHIQRKFP